METFFEIRHWFCWILILVIPILLIIICIRHRIFIQTIIPDSEGYVGYTIYICCVSSNCFDSLTLPSTICQNIKATNCRNQLYALGGSYIKKRIGTDYIHFLRPRPIKFNKPTWITHKIQFLNVRSIMWNNDNARLGYYSFSFF